MPEAPVEGEAPEPVPPGTKTKEEKANEVIANVLATSMLRAAEDSKLALTLNVKSLKDELKQQKADQSDMYYYLNKKCDDSYEVISALEEQLLTEQSDREISEKMYERKIEHLELELEGEKHTLGTKVAKLEKELEGIQKFIMQKASMEKEITTLKCSLDKERLNCKAVVTDMEQQWTLERTRLRKQGEQALADLRSEYERGLDERLTDKTRKIMVRNAQIEEEMSFQSKQADKVLAYNQQVLDEDKNLKVNLKLSQAMEAELLGEMAMYQKTIKKLNETVRDLKSNFQATDAKISIKDEEIGALKDELNRTRNDSSRDKNSLFDEIWVYLTREFESLGALSSSSRGQQEEFSKLTKIQREEKFVATIKRLLEKFPELISPSLKASTSTEQQKLRRSPRLSVFPAMSPPGKSNKAVSRRLESMFKNGTNHVATQTNESNVGNALNEDSLWLTGRKEFIQGQSSLSYYNQNDFSASVVSQESGMLSGNLSIDNDLSVKSASAVPPSKSMKHRLPASTHRPRMQGLIQGLSPQIKESALVPSSSASVGSSHSGSRSVPVDMRIFREGSNTRQPAKGATSQIPGITGQSKAIFHGGSLSPQKGKHFAADLGGISPQSSVSMSPRDREDNSTIVSLSPRHGNDMADDV